MISLAPVKTIEIRGENSEHIYDIAIAPSGSRVAISTGKASHQRQIVVFEMNGKEYYSPQFVAGGERGLEFWPDENHILCIGRQVRGWEVGSSHFHLEFEKILDRRGFNFLHRLLMSKLKRYILITGWHAEPPPILIDQHTHTNWIIPNHETSAFSNNDIWFGIANGTQTQLWNLENRMITARRESKLGEKVLAVSPGGGQVITTETPLLYAWDALSNSRRLLSSQGGALPEPKAADYSLDGKIFMTGHDKGQVVIWSVSNLNIQRIMTVHSEHVTMVKSSSHGTKFVTADRNSAVIWE